MSIRKNLLYNTSYQILNIILPIITTPYISRVLGVNGVGENSYALSIATYFGLLIMLGLNNYGNREIAAIRSDKELLKQKFWSIYYMQLIIGIVVMIVYTLYSCMLSRTIITLVYMLYVLSYVIDINWLFFGLEEFKITALRSIAIKILSTIAIFLFVKEEHHAYIYGAIISLSMLLSNMVMWPYVVKNINYYKPDFKEIKTHIYPNLVLFVPVISVSIYKILSKIMLGILGSNTELGYYDSVDKIITIPTVLVTSLGVVMLPRMSKIIADKKANKMREYITNSLMFSVMVAVPMCMGLASVADIFVPLFFGMNYEKCIILMRIMLPSCIFLAIANVIRTQYLVPSKKDKIYVLSVIIGAIVNVIFNIFLIPTMGAEGATWSLLFAEVSVCTYQVIAVRKELPIGVYIKKIMPYILIGIAMYMVVTYAHIQIDNLYIELLYKICLGAIIYMLPSTIIFIIQNKTKIALEERE